MKRLLLAIWMLCLPAFFMRAGGQTPVEAARRAAESFLASHARKGTADLRAETAPYTQLALLASDRAPSGTCYLFAPENGEGFVLVAESPDGMRPVGYSETGLLTQQDMPEALVSLMHGYATRNTYSLHGSATGMREAVSPVSPLLKSRRSQYEPYNGMCPYYTYENGTVSPGRCLVGCVATAIEGVFNYYRYPDCLLDTIAGWTTPNYTLEDIAAGTPIHWEHILDDYGKGYTEEQARAVQELSLYCAMAVHMNFGVSASGANVAKAAPELTRIFGYGTSEFRDRSRYTPVAWNAMLRHELASGRPVVYVGYNYTGGGHCFVIDGQDSDGLYHLNWGYGGNADGYFLLDVLNPYERADDYTTEGLHQGLYCSQGALFLHPEKGADILSPDTLPLRRGEITVDRVEFPHQPETSVYIPATVTVTNHGTDTVTYTFELFTYLPSDTAVYKQGIGAGVGCATLLPRSTVSATSYCRFSRGGDQILGVVDEDTICYTAPLNVTKGTSPLLTLSAPRVTELKPQSVTFETDIRNGAASGCSGNWVTYTLYYEDEETGTSHWSFAEIPAGESKTDSVSFLHLRPGHRYTLKIRYPWTIVGECIIRTPDATGITETPAHDGHVWRIYTMQGVFAGTVTDTELAERGLQGPPAVYILKNDAGDTRKVRAGGYY